MTALALNHAGQRPQKVALFDAVHADIKAQRGFVWSFECREQSVIVGQIGDKPFIVAVKLPGKMPPDSVMAAMVQAFKAGAIAHIVRQPGDLAKLRVWTGR